MSLKRALVWLALLAGVCGNLLVLAIGGWHVYRYEIAPRLGWLDVEERWRENVTIATSAFYKPDEKVVALDRLLAMRDYAATLSDVERRRVADRLREVALIEFFPLDVKYKASRARAMLIGERQVAAALPVVVDPDADAATRAAEFAAIAASVTATADGLRRSSPERTRFFVERFRQDPCQDELVQLLERFLARDDLPPVERSFLFGIQAEYKARCF